MGIRIREFFDHGSGMDKIRIRDKHSGSATLEKAQAFKPMYFL
jgi:hypothetical protein